MKMIEINKLSPGDLFAKSSGSSAEIGKLLADAGGGYVYYEDEYGYKQVMNSQFYVWID